jgi:23S rRNA (adenine-N6)-dimethyltransferase
VSARRRTQRDERRRHLSQNFLRAEAAGRFVRDAGFSPGELVVEIGPGSGSITLALARRGVDLIAVELDRAWADRLRSRVRSAGHSNVRIAVADFRSFQLPEAPFRVVGSLPFGQTTSILGHLLDDPARPLIRADLILQWEVARKRAAQPPSTLRCAGWAPWWEFHLGRRILARSFRPIPRVDGGVLSIVRRRPSLLPDEMAASYASFIGENWPFTGRQRR